jgi:hypothetical protein
LPNTLNPNTVFELLHNTINGLFLPTQGFGELTAPNIVNILPRSTQISIGLVRKTDPSLRVVTVNCSHCSRCIVTQTQQKRSMQSENIHPVAGGSLGQTLCLQLQC